MKTPRWETVAIVISFACVWVYFMVWIAAGRNHTPLSPYWQLFLLPALVVMVVVFVRRTKRSTIAMREAQLNAHAFGRSPSSPKKTPSKKSKKSE